MSGFDGARRDSYFAGKQVRRINSRIELVID